MGNTSSEPQAPSASVSSPSAAASSASSSASAAASASASGGSRLSGAPGRAPRSTRSSAMAAAAAAAPAAKRSRKDRSLAALQHLEPTEEDQELFHAAEEAYRQSRDAARKAASAHQEKRRGQRVSQGGRGGSNDKVDSKLECIYFGDWQVMTWYSSPYPAEYLQQDRIWVCEFCLQYFKTEGLLARHMEKPHDVHPPHPPGDEIYRKGDLSVWEVDGKKRKIYCQNLCLLGKLFLDTKTLYYDVEPFLFYVLTEWDQYGAHFAGYFSKEKQSFLNYNLSCIMVMPQHQRKGYGRALIDFSYLLTRKEGKVGTPEKPLSDLGLLSYRAYWKDIILEYLEKYRKYPQVSISRLSQETGINTYDIISTLQSLSMVKYWRGKHVLVTQAEVEAEHKLRQKRRPVQIDAAALRWTPLVIKDNTTV